MVIRRIENEQGWTLSKTAERSTSGRSHAPLLLTLQKSCVVSGLYFKNTIAASARMVMANMVMTLFIYALGRNSRAYSKLKHGTFRVGERNSPIDCPHSSWPMSVWIIHDFYTHRCARLNNLICRRN